MTRVGLICLLLGTIGLVSPSFADESPGTGHVVNARENSALTFQCSLPRNDVIDCAFTQSRIRKVGKPENLKSRLEGARESFREHGLESVEGRKSCAEIATLIEVYEGKRSEPKVEAIAKMSDKEKKDSIELLRSIDRACKSPTLENYLAFIRLGHEREMRTCVVSAYAFKQTFRRLASPKQGPSTWVVQSSPTGPCGVVELSRFEPYNKMLLGKPFPLWRYVAKKAVTNPKGEGALLQCSELDESEYVYEMQSHDRYVGCDYIKFEVF